MGRDDLGDSEIFSDCGVAFDIGSLRDARQMQPWNRKAACFDTPLLLIVADAILRKVLHQSIPRFSSPCTVRLIYRFLVETEMVLIPDAHYPQLPLRLSVESSLPLTA